MNLSRPTLITPARGDRCSSTCLVAASLCEALFPCISCCICVCVPRYIRVTNHPLPLTNREHLAIDTFLSILAAIFCMIPFCYLAGNDIQGQKAVARLAELCCTDVRI